MKSVLVTGASGFIGSHLCEYLDGLEESRSLGLDRTFARVQGDITDREAIEKVVGKSDGVIHLAGILGTSELIGDLRQAIEVNIVGALNIYDAIREYQIPAVQITVGNYTWLNAYSITKYTAERLALMYNQEFGTRISVVRGLNVYGPRQKHYPVRKVVPTFIYRALREEAIEVFGNGEQVMDLVYVKDLCNVLSKAVLNDHGCYDRVFEAGAGYPITVNTLAEMVRDICNSSSNIIHAPMRPGEPVDSRTIGNPSTLSPLGIKGCDFTPLEDGLRETVDWYYHSYPWKDS